MAEPLLATGQRGGRERSGRLESIDVLRGVAVLSVGVTHLPFSWGTTDAGGVPALAGWITGDAAVPTVQYGEGPRPAAEREHA